MSGAAALVLDRARGVSTSFGRIEERRVVAGLEPEVDRVARLAA
jgi:hypothetical protein